MVEARPTRTLLLDSTQALATERVPGRGGAALQAGDRIGPFRLIEEIGSGGMGVVFLAEQTEPLQRRVALKLMKADFRDAFAEAMFLVERQALARLEHPHIAGVYEAGSTDDGLLYFAMEWVDGQRIDQHCRTHQLSQKQVVQLMVAVCRGVQHAHTRGIVHRDLKPANILVGLVDGRPVPKIIDFGIASAPGQAHDQVVGTLGYMAPEQARAGGPVDQRADVYALGVILLELMTSSMGQEQQSWWGLDASMRERMLIARECCSPQAAGLIDGLGPDLRAVLAKTLAVDRERRYSGAEALAEDLLRWLGNFPVHARLRTPRYVFACLIRRHRLAAAMVSDMLLVLLLALASSLLAWRQAEREGLKASRTAAFLESVLQGIDPRQAQGLDRRLLELILRNAAERVDIELREEPEVRAEVLRSIAASHVGVGDGKQAVALIEAARPQLLGRLSAVQQAALDRTLLQGLRQDGQIERARELAEDLYARERFLFAADDPQRVESIGALLTMMRSAGQLEMAREFGEARWDELRAAPDLTARSRIRVELALVYSLLGERDRAIAMIEDDIAELAAERGPDALRVTSVRMELGVMQFRAGRYTEARDTFVALLPTYEHVFGPEHIETLSVRGNLAAALTMSGDPLAAIPVVGELLRIRESLGGPEHPETLIALGNLAATSYRAAQFQEAEAAFARYWDLCIKLYQPAHPGCAERRVGHGKVLRELGRHAEAEAILLDAYRLKQQVEGRQFAGPEETAHELAKLYRLMGRTQDAERWEALATVPEAP